MSKVTEAGDAAKRLKNDETFQDVFKEIRDAQVGVFLDDRSSQEDREAAHVMIRALGKFDDAITLRIENGKFVQQKGQHRGSD